MFKDVYKRANDSIDTRDAYKRIMEKIEVQKKRKNSYRHVYNAAAIAACLVIAVSTGVYVHISNNIETEKIAKLPEKTLNQDENDLVKSKDIETVTKNFEEDTAEIAKETVKSVQTPEKTEEKLPDKKVVKKEVKKAEPQPLQTNMPEEKAVSVPIPTVSPKERAQKLDIKINEPLYAASEMYAGDAIMKKSSDGSESNAIYAIAEEDALRQKEITLDEYYNYLGKDVKKSLTLPQGFADQTADPQMLCVDADSNYSCDNWIFMYVCEDKRIEITTTKNTADVKDILNSDIYQKSSIYGIEAVVVKNGDVFTAYIIKDNIAYTVECCSITLADLQNLLVSIAQ